LCQEIPNNVSSEQVAFMVIRIDWSSGYSSGRADIKRNSHYYKSWFERFIVVQLLLTHGCKVIASDFDQRKLAQSFSIDAGNVSNIVEYIMSKTNGRGTYHCFHQKQRFYFAGCSDVKETGKNYFGWDYWS
jgi:hypothetical protein